MARPKRRNWVGAKVAETEIPMSYRQLVSFVEGEWEKDEGVLWRDITPVSSKNRQLQFCLEEIDAYFAVPRAQRLKRTVTNTTSFRRLDSSRPHAVDGESHESLPHAESK